MSELIKALENGDIEEIRNNLPKEGRSYLEAAAALIGYRAGEEAQKADLASAYLAGCQAGKDAMRERVEDLEHRIRGLESALDEAADKWAQIGGDLEFDLPLVAMAIATRPIAQPAPNTKE